MKDRSLPMKKFIKTAFAGLLLCLLLLAGSISVHAQIQFDRASVNVLNGSSRKVRISCKGKYSVATTDDSIATVTHSGKVKGKKAGSCEIVVTCGAESARLPVHVLRSLRDGSILFLGHRGYQGKYPENTISSFEGALNYGADGVELDVHITNSKDLLVFHDGSLSRVSGKQGKIRNLTEQTRKKYRVKGGGKSDAAMRISLRAASGSAGWKNSALCSTAIVTASGISRHIIRISRQGFSMAAVLPLRRVAICEKLLPEVPRGSSFTVKDLFPSV